MNKVLVIVGATASGKSALGIKLAKLLNGEIISGDSVQVYKHFNIGSAKISKEEMAGVKHYLIDELDIKDDFSVYDFQKKARAYIKQITASHKLPIIVGGTGLYIRAALYDYQFEEIDHCDYQWDNYDDETLYKMLVDIDPLSAQKIHPNNKRRIIRALDIYHGTSNTKSSLEAKQSHQPIYDVMMIGIKPERKLLYQRIEARVEAMFKNGLVDEVEDLLNRGVSFDDKAFKAIGYKEFKEYFEGQIDLAEVKRLIIKHTKNYAKRQETWFNNKENVYWIDGDNCDQLIDKVKDWQNAG